MSEQEVAVGRTMPLWVAPYIAAAYSSKERVNPLPDLRKMFPGDWHGNPTAGVTYNGSVVWAPWSVYNKRSKARLIMALAMPGVGLLAALAGSYKVEEGLAGILAIGGILVWSWWVTEYVKYQKGDKK